MEDLKERICPTAEELQAAVDWLLNRETSYFFLERVRKVAMELGYDDIAERISE